MTPRPGDFACVHVKGNVGTLITLGQFLNGSRAEWYDHACVYVGQPDLQAPWGYVMGAQPSGARLDPLRHAQYDGTDSNWLWSTGKINLVDAQRQQIVASALACKGIPYGWADYFALAAHRFRIPIPHLRAYIASSKSMICSQLVAWCYEQAGIQLFSDERHWEGYVTPADLAELISA